jgi:hypothetical protein
MERYEGKKVVIIGGTSGMVLIAVRNRATFAAKNEPLPRQNFFFANSLHLALREFATKKSSSF